MRILTGAKYRKQLRALAKCSDTMLNRYQAQRYGYTFVDLANVDLHPSVLETISPETAIDLNVVPVRLDGRNLWVCMELPPCLRSLERLRIETRCNVIPVGISPDALWLSVQFYYPEPIPAV